MKVLALYTIFLVPFIQCYTFKDFVSKPALNFILSKLNTLVDRSIAHSKCSSDLKSLISDSFKWKLWAIKMLDASVKLNAGFLSGHIHQLGHFEECLSINETVGNRVIAGQYCSIFLEPTVMDSVWNVTHAVKEFKLLKNVPESIGFFKVILGICIPRSCSVENLNQLWNFLEKSFELPLHVTLKDEYCTFKGKPIRPYKIDFYVYIFFGTIIAIALGSTGYDLFLKFSGRKPNILTIYSFCTNIKQLFSIHCEHSNLTCLYGLKVLSIFWIIYGHIALTKGLRPNVNGLYILHTWRYSWSSSIIMSGYHAIDAFLVISGLLVVYVQMKYLEKFKFGIFSFYLHRVVRLMPALFATVLFYISIMKHMTEGPAWPFLVKATAENCYNTWWATLFFLTNFLPISYRCVMHTWYLTVDTQLYLAAPLFFLLIKKWPKKIVPATMAVCTISMFYIFLLILLNNIKCDFMEIESSCYRDVYHSAISRMPSWLLGALCGYFIYKYDHKTNKISETLNRFLLFVSLTVIFLFILFFSQILTYQENVWFSAVFNTVGRLLWCLALCFIIYNCCTDGGGFINTFLSHPIFIVIGKLNYSIYLIHMGVILPLAGGQMQAGHFSSFQIFYEFWGTSVLVLLLAAVFFLLFECPAFMLLKHLEKQTLQKKVRKLKGDEENLGYLFNELGPKPKIL